ncbi:MAG TPA: hypothetical protein PLL10_01445 [Elusimicrobiales bacterium]|nr:hypothetical protein [Elusimicrobiales bacterium]
MENAGGFSLYFKEAELPAYSVLADVFAEVYPLSQEEAFHKARHCWGIVAENIDAEQAGRLEESFRRAGLELLRFESDKMPLPPQPLPAHSLALTNDGFSCVLDGDAAESCRWNDLEIAAAAPVKEELIKKETHPQGPSLGRAVSILSATTLGIPLPLGGQKPAPEREMIIREMNYIMDLYFKGRRVRLRSDAMDYSSLGAEKSYSSQGNFRALACKLEPLASSALKNKGLKLIAARQPLQSLSYDSLADFERDFRRLFALLAVAGQG